MKMEKELTLATVKGFNDFAKKIQENDGKFAVIHASVVQEVLEEVIKHLEGSKEESV